MTSRWADWRSSGVGGLLESEEPLHARQHSRILPAGGVDLTDDVEGFADRLHDADTQSACGGRQEAFILAPHEDGARFGIDDDVEAILGTIVDDDVERERVGDTAARALYDEHAREREPFRFEPALALNLCGRPGGFGPLGEEDDLPAPLERQRGQPLDDARLQLAERLPEVFNRLHVPPQAPLLPRTHA